MNIILKKIKRLIWDDSKSIDRVHKYWVQPDDGTNKPIDYTKRVEKSEFLFKQIQQFSPQMRILEIGCNVGRNLNFLFEKGYKNLSGIEISENAIEQMQIVFPSMFNQIKVFNSSVEDIIKSPELDKFDLIFTMAVMEHIHSDSNWIFAELAKLSEKYIITIEDEKSISWKHFPRNYKKVFEKIGMKQIDYQDCSKIKGFHNGFYYRLFEKIPT